MIADNIKNAGIYYGVGKSIEKALKYVEQTDFSAMEPGKYAVDGDNIYALVQKYESNPVEEGVWESHRKYADVQFVFSGAERMGWVEAAKLNVTEEYDEKGDCVLYEGEGNMLTYSAGSFAVYFPEDAHMPCIAAGKPSQVTKVVVKVKL